MGYGVAWHGVWGAISGVENATRFFKTVKTKTSADLRSGEAHSSKFRRVALLQGHLRLFDATVTVVIYLSSR